MVLYKKIGLVVFLLTFVILAANGEYEVPEVKFEAIRSGGFRVSIPATSEIERFVFNANINEDVLVNTIANINGEVTTPTNGVFIIEFDNTLKVGDIVHYNVLVQNAHLGFRKNNLSWLVVESDLQDSYAPVGPSCRTATTTVNNEQTSCVGKLIIFDEFDGPTVDTSKWTIEHRIPTYTGINNELNSYQNRDETRFIKNGVLYLKPIPFQKEEELRGVLDLKQGCTSSDVNQCYYEQRGVYLLPPVKSARITSKIPFKYGKVEINAKLPEGEWLVPVVELESQEQNSSGFAPKIFIAYSRGNDHLTGSSGDDIGSRLLYAGPVLRTGTQRNQNLVTQRRTKPYSSDFHIYTLEWLPGKMSFYINSQLYGSIDTRDGFPEFESTWTAPDAPFNKEYLLSLGVAVGGFDDFPDGYVSGNNPRPWDYKHTNFLHAFFNARNVWSRTWKGDNSALQVEYVKVWAV